MVLYAKDIVEPDFISLKGEVNALEAARMMKSKSHGFVIVESEDRRPKGIVTEWDYISKVVAEGKDPSKVSLAEIMSGNLLTVKASDGIDQVAHVMAERGVRRVLVLENGKILGAITAKTVLGRLQEYIDRISGQIARLNSPTF